MILAEISSPEASCPIPILFPTCICQWQPPLPKLIKEIVEAMVHAPWLVDKDSRPDPCCSWVMTLMSHESGVTSIPYCTLLYCTVLYCNAVLHWCWVTDWHWPLAMLIWSWSCTCNLQVGIRSGIQHVWFGSLEFAHDSMWLDLMHLFASRWSEIWWAESIKFFLSYIINLVSWPCIEQNRTMFLLKVDRLQTGLSGLMVS